MKIEHTYILYFYLLIAFFVFVFWRYRIWRKKKLRAFADTKLWDEIIPLRSPKKAAWKFSLFLLSFAFLLFAMANPLIGSKIKKAERKGVELMICLDISNSMMANDIKPSRLQNAKQSISQLIDRLEGDRIGLVVFAGDAFKQLPLTNDYAAAKIFLQSIHPGLIRTQGTDIAKAIDLALSSFPETNTDKAIIIISDGEDHEGNAEESAAMAHEQGVKIFTMGMGLPEGAPIPEKINDQIVFKKDNDGKTVISKINEQMLQNIAQTGDGIYIRANNNRSALDLLFDEIRKMEEKTFDSIDYSDYETRFQYPLLISLILLISSILLPERKGKYAEKFTLFKE
jgi:Ca-activated chloride channel family protein